MLGATKSAKPVHNEQIVRGFLSPFLIVWPNELVVSHYVDIRYSLESGGQRISEQDLWMAASARAFGDVAVTNNVSEFKRVSGLTVQDWSM